MRPFKEFENKSWNTLVTVMLCSSFIFEIISGSFRIGLSLNGWSVEMIWVFHDNQVFIRSSFYEHASEATSQRHFFENFHNALIASETMASFHFHGTYTGLGSMLKLTILYLIKQF